MQKDKLTKLASALSYKQNDNAPVVVASGKGTVADAIIETAKKHNVPVYEDPDCAYLLSFSDIGKEIPEDLYLAVAKILAFVCDIDKNYNTDR